MQSLLIDNGEACTEVGQKLTSHVQKYHITDFQKLQNDGSMLIAIGMSYLLTKRFAKISKEEEFFQRNYSVMTERLMQLLGFEEVKEESKEELKTIDNLSTTEVT